MREASISRKTGETDISVNLNLDGAGKYNIDTGVGFLNHMLCSFARHSRFDLIVKAVGGYRCGLSSHYRRHGIVLGEAFKNP